MYEMIDTFLSAQILKHIKSWVTQQCV